MRVVLFLCAWLLAAPLAAPPGAHAREQETPFAFDDRAAGLRDLSLSDCGFGVEMIQTRSNASTQDAVLSAHVASALLRDDGLCVPQDRAWAAGIFWRTLHEGFFLEPAFRLALACEEGVDAPAEACAAPLLQIGVELMRAADFGDTVLEERLQRWSLPASIQEALSAAPRLVDRDEAEALNHALALAERARSDRLWRAPALAWLDRVDLDVAERLPRADRLRLRLARAMVDLVPWTHGSHRLDAAAELHWLIVEDAYPEAVLAAARLFRRYARTDRRRAHALGLYYRAARLGLAAPDEIAELEAGLPDDAQRLARQRAEDDDPGVLRLKRLIDDTFSP